MDLATGAMNSLLPKLSKLLQEEYKLHKGVRGGIRFLVEELKSTAAALRDVGEVPRDQLDEQVRLWADEVRELSYRMDASVDSLLMRIEGSERADNPDGLKSFVKKTASLFTKAKIRNQIADAIIDMNDHIHGVTERRVRYMIDHVVAYPDAIVDPRLLALYRDQRELVGIEEPRDELIKMLCEGDDLSIQQGLKIISISGFGGFGKTTLAKAVLDSLRVKFECTAFVSVGQKPNGKKIFRDILFGLDKQKCKSVLATRDQEDETIKFIKELRTLLENKRYLIVVDDIWDICAWRMIRPVFDRESMGSAVLMTTRKMDVAQCADVVYKLAPLSKHCSTKLFYQTLFGSGCCPPEFSDISEKVIEKCSGMPLAIINTASLLESKGKQLEDWYQVHDSNFLDDTYGTRTILGLSYTDLPTYLKACMLYLSMFHKGCEISVDRLVLGWVAEGFICESYGKSCWDIGEAYLNELTNRNLIIPVELDANGKALSYRVCNMVHDLISSLSAEVNFATILDGRQGRLLPETVHRLSIQGNNVEDQGLAQVQFSLVRSLVVSGDANLMPSLTKFQGLRVLDLSGCVSLQNDHLKDIETLFPLRCLIIGGNHITDIPKNIGNLLFLQILDLRASTVKELPASIVQARKLKCLRVNSRTKIPDEVVKMESLEVLADINISKPALLKELCSLTNLIVLGISIWSWDGSYDDSLLECLCSLGREERIIQSLSILTCSSLHFLDKLEAEWAPPRLKRLEIRKNTFFTLPRWICSLKNLTTLSIGVYKLSQDIIETLGKLQNLLVLSLTSKHAPEGKFGNGNNAFIKLESLHFASNAMGKIFEPRAVLKLKRLRLSFEASRTEEIFQGFDFGLENLSSIEHACVEIICFNANLGLVEGAEAAILKAINACRSHRPNVEIQRVREEEILENEQVRVDNIKQEEHKRTKKMMRMRVKEKGIVRKYKVSGSLTLKAI